MITISDNSLQIVPLGGVGEIGKNITAYKYGSDVLVVDCGLMFPDEEMLGVDLVIPDTTWLKDPSNNVVGVCLTHGHEDHIGSLPYFLKEFDVPVWGTPLTLGLVKSKLDEHKITNIKLNEVEAGDVIEAGPFSVEFVQVSHSIPDACSLAITTPLGVVVHTSDFKFDPTPVDGRLTDIGRFSELGRNGILALVTDSTNVEKPGFADSERLLGRTFDRLFSEARGRVIVACFASNLHRIQQVADASVKYGRQIAFVGRSMARNVDIACKLGYLDIPDWAFLDIDEISARPKDQVTIMTTGSQGEPLSALSRISMDDHRRISIEEGDLVVISAKPIPGNENLVMRVVNNLFRQGAQVVYSEIDMVHVSGHANQDELRMMLNLLDPDYVIPVHGEYRHMAKYREMARETGYEPHEILTMDIGDILQIDSDGAQVVGKIEQSGSVMVDGLGVGDVGDVSLRDRSHLASEGIIIAVVSIDKATGEILAGPELMSKGVMDEWESFLAEARERLMEHLSALPHDAIRDGATAKLEIRNALAKFVKSQIRRRPVIIPVVTEV